jgi:hypothetical protein
MGQRIWRIGDKMSNISEIEKLTDDYEKRIQRLKNLEKDLVALNTDGFEEEVAAIKKYIKDPKSLEKIENNIKNLKNKIDERKKISDKKEQIKEKKILEEPKEISTSPPRGLFPYELTPDYKNVGLIGSGGFARVFRANRKKDDKEVAVKIPVSLDRSIGKSFMREMDTWTKLKHQNIVELYDHNILPVPYFEMELCDLCLETLSKPMEIEKSSWIIFNVAEGLKYAHDKGIAHRDIKPQNILLKEGIPKISDWGLSKLTEESKTSTTASTALSIYYAAPEQISKKFGAKDEQTDIWQLGAVFYELVTGKPPFKEDGDDTTETLFKITSEDYVLPSEYNQDAVKVDDIIKKCLQKEKPKRYKNIDRLQIDLAKVLNIEYVTKIKECQDVNDQSKSAYFCGELLLVKMKIGDKQDAYKHASDMLKYARDEIKDELKNLCKELEERIENNLDINEKLIEKADIIMHKIRSG